MSVYKEIVNRIMWRLSAIKMYVLYYFFTEYYFIAFPKSGMTWIKFFIKKYLFELYSFVPEDSFQRIFSIKYPIPSMYFTHLGPSLRGGGMMFRILKICDENYLEKYIHKSKNKKILYISRDPRDVVVSYYFHRRHLSSCVHEKDIKMEDFIRDKKTGIVPIINYMNKWYEHRDIFDEFLLIY